MKILLATDGSPCSQVAVNELCKRPWPAGSAVEVVTAVHAPIVPDPFLIGVIVYDEMIDRQRKAAAELLEKTTAQIREQAPDLAVETKTLEGPPKEVIVEEARRWGADLILVGSHGYGPARRFVLGSVSHAVALHAHCSVEIVRGCPPPPAE